LKLKDGDETKRVRGEKNGKNEAGGRGGALDTYSRWKVVYRDFSGRLQKAQIDQ
jgi:aldehyde dehydrogenase (NAD+)